MTRHAAVALVLLAACGTTAPAKCDARSCQGCCDRDTCVTVAEQSDSLCGLAGAECSGCASGVCTQGQCQLVDPCANNGGCDVNATCAAVSASRTCTCATGFDGNGVTCSPLLSDLTVSAGHVSPGFRPTSVSYLDVIPAATTTLTVTAATAARASIVIDGASGPSRTFTPGATPQTVVIEVRATAGTASRRYTLQVIRSNTTLSQRASMKPSNTRAGLRFGAAVAISGDGSTVAVGAPMEGSDATGIGGNQASIAAARSGAVYVFRNTAGAWAQEAYVKASNTGAFDNFGWSLGLSTDGSTLAVGATGEDGPSNAALDSGAVYVYRRTGASWAQEATVRASAGETGDGFGWAVALSGSGDRLAVGAPFDDGAGNATESSGAVWVFGRAGASWSQDTVVRAASSGRGDQFGRAVALSGDGLSLAVGAPAEESGARGIVVSLSVKTRSGSGAVYVFSRGAGWSADAYVKATNTDIEDRFGTAVALSFDGAVLAVGAPGESSDALAVDGDPASNAAPASGAVYVLRRAAGWAHEAYVKATNTGDGDRFGAAVGLSSDGATLVVGAPGDDSDAVGIDGNQASNAATDSGAVFVYRKAASWARLAYAKASLPGAGDVLSSGVSVAASGATWVCGAQGEDSSATGVNGDLSANDAMESGAAFVFAE